MLPDPQLLQAADATEQFELYSDYLSRDVRCDVYRTGDLPSAEPVSLLLVNDGQDLLTMPFANLLQQVSSDYQLFPLLVIAIHCGEDRKMEYGVAYSADFKGRGAKAGLYGKFILMNCFPLLESGFI